MSARWAATHVTPKIRLKKKSREAGDELRKAKEKDKKSQHDTRAPISTK